MGRRYLVHFFLEMLILHVVPPPVQVVMARRELLSIDIVTLRYHLLSINLSLSSFRFGLLQKKILRLLSSLSLN